VNVYPFSLANPVWTRLPEELKSTIHMAAPGPVPRAQVAAKHGAQYDAGTLSA
jgi:hypothetical protein